MTPTAPTQGTFCWYECATRHAPEARTFYAELFGWTARDEPMPGQEGAIYTMFSREGRDIAGLYAMDGDCFDGVPPHWATYLEVEDVDASVDTVRALGGTVVMDPMDVPELGRMSVIQDPQGAKLHLWCLADGCTPSAREGRPGEFCWSELATTDTEGARRFYTQLAGWTTQAQEMAPGMVYTSFLRGDRPVGGMMSMNGPAWEGVSPHWTNYVSVADTDAIARETVALGGKLLVAPADIPKVGRFAVIQDPTGAVLSVIALADTA